MDRSVFDSAVGVESQWENSTKFARLTSLGLGRTHMEKNLKTIFIAGAVLAVWGLFGKRILRSVEARFGRVVRLNRSIYVKAPIDLAFDFVSRFGEYPKFMSYVQDVQVNEDGGVHWTVGAPGRIPLEWDASITSLIPHQEVSWATRPGSMIRHEGRIGLYALSAARTRMDVELTFAPPVGVVGMAVAHILGFDPRSRFDADLATLRTSVEDDFKRLSHRYGISNGLEA